MNKHRTDTLRQFTQGLQVAGQAMEVFTEKAGVGFQLFRRVVFRVCRDQQVVRFGHIRRQQLIGLAQVGHGRRADIRAVGVAHKHERPLALQVIAGDGFTLFVGKGELRQGSWLLVHISVVLAQVGRRHWRFTGSFQEHLPANCQAEYQHDHQEQDKQRDA